MNNNTNNENVLDKKYLRLNLLMQLKEGNYEDLTDKLTRLLENKNLSDKMGEEGKKFIKEQFNWELVARNFLEMIKPYVKTA